MGIGFFLRYSIDKGWIAPTGRVALAIFVGVGLLVAGISGLAALISIRALLAGVSPHGWVRWTAWLQNWTGPPVLGALILIFLLFPDGKLLTRR